MKLLLYCTKAKPYLYKTEDTTYPAYPIGYHTDTNLKVKLSNTNELANLNGKIVAECDFEVEEINYRNAEFVFNRYYLEILKKSCLTDKQMYDYLKGEKGYAIHIKNLHIFDKPIDIINYYNIAPRTMQDCMNQKALLKAPQNMCNAYDVYKNHYIVISIQPQWLCKILNGEKTIEVRKKVLKEMLR